MDYDVITNKQEAYYNFIVEFYGMFNIYPKLSDITKHFNVIPQNSITILDSLENKGYIEKNEEDKRYCVTDKKICKLTHLQKLCLNYVVLNDGDISSTYVISKEINYPQTSVVTALASLEKQGYIQKIPAYYKVLKHD